MIKANTPGTHATGPPNSVDDSRVLRAVEDYADLLRKSERPDRDAFLAQHVDIADAVARCLDGLEFVHAAGRDLSRSGDPADGGDLLLSGVPLGDYQLIRELGRGGMGVVYEAEQLSLGRRVALKVLPLAATMDPRQLQRFKNEARAAAGLHHEHIVPVYGVGCERGVHHYAMQLIDGVTLADVIAGRAGSRERLEKRDASVTGPYPEAPTPAGSPDTPPVAALSTKIDERAYYRRAAKLVADAADALEYAHSVGIVHRDVKPGNLLVDTAGKLWVADFGLARFGPDVGLTMSGDLLGTLRYMAPEQALARHGLADHRVDVYGLGCVLYELLTGRPAVRGDDKATILSDIAFADPVAPRKVDRNVPAELETVALKCLGKNPDDRYPSAGEVAADLRRWLADQPIRARRPTVRQRLIRWARRHPAVVAVIGLLAGLVMAGVWAWHRETTHAETAARVVAAEADEFRTAGRYSEALLAARRAADLLPRFGGSPTLRQEVTGRAAALQLLTRLEEARLEQAAPRAGGSDEYDGERAVPLFRDAFLDYGVDVLGGEPSAVAAALRGSAVRRDALAAIMEWWAVTREARHRHRLAELVETLDVDDPKRVTTRAVRALGRGDMAAARQLATEAEADVPPPEVVYRLANQLRATGALVEAERLARAAHRRYPADHWTNLLLGATLCDMVPRPVEFSRAPGVPGVPLQPTDAERAAEAVRFLTAAVAVRPHSAGHWSALGTALRKQGRNPDAEAALRRAVEANPNDARPYVNLFAALYGQKKLPEAEAALRRAIELRPDYAMAHANLGVVLFAQSRLPEAEAALATAVALRPDYAEGHMNLGGVLRARGRLAEAQAAIRRAAVLKPTDPTALMNLGAIAFSRGQFAESERAYRRALDLQPTNALLLCRLGDAVQRQGRLTEGLELRKRGHEQGSKLPDWKWPSAEWVRQSERLVALDAKLAAVVAGIAQPADPAERLALAGFCSDYAHRYVAAVRFYADAFAADPKLADDRQSQRRYNAACAAALAAAGRGADAAGLTVDDRSRFRRQALDWLRADFTDLANAAAAEAGRAAVSKALRHWQEDPDLEGVRAAARLVALPETERSAWAALWADVAGLLAKADGPGEPAHPHEN